MHILFDEAGKFLTGRLLSEAGSSLHVKLESGKRVKVKTANALLRFEKPAPAELLKEANTLAEAMELELAYEFAPEDEFGFADLAREYYSDQASTAQQAAALLTLQNAPHYFRRAGKGRFKKAPPEIVAQALAAIEKKKQVQAQIEQWAAELAAGRCPEAVRQQLYRILFRPDKNGPEYKAVVEAARLSHTAPLVLLQNAGAISSPYQFHWQRFLFEHFPKGTGFPALAAPAVAEELPLAPVQAFSIDDSATTEIDDALSLQGLGTGTVTLGIHIAAPGLAIAPGSALDEIARQRLSTVYMPGHKITMLPDEVVQAYTLEAGRECPAISLYVELDVQRHGRAVAPCFERVGLHHGVGQHGDLVARHVDGGQAIARDVVQRAVGRDGQPRRGDVDAQGDRAAAQALQRERVVDLGGGGVVDGEGHDGGQWQRLGDRRSRQRREARALGEVFEQEALPVELVGAADGAGVLQ